MSRGRTDGQKSNRKEVGTDHEDGKGNRRATGRNQTQPKRNLERETGARKEEAQAESDLASERTFARTTTMRRNIKAGLDEERNRKANFG